MRRSSTRRELLVGTAASLVSVPLFAHAQATASSTFPSRTVRFIVPFPAGGSADALVRKMAPKLEAAWGQQVIVLNKPGAGTVLATHEVVQATPDGHTIGLVIPAVATNASLMPKLPYNTQEDIVGVTQLVSLPIALYASPNVKARSVPELIAHARSASRPLTYGSAGIGSISHLSGQLLKHMTGIDLVHVGYKGSVPAQMDLASGDLDLLFDTTAAAKGMHDSGKIRMLATAGAAKSAKYAATPRIGDTVRGFSVESYFGVIVAKNTPGSIVASLHAALVNAIAQPDVAAWIKDQDMVLAGTKPEEWQAQLRSDIQQWSQLVSTLKIKLGS